MSDRSPVRIAILGGSSVSTPLLIEALAHALRQEQFPPLRLRLHGRHDRRLAAVAEYGRRRLREIAPAADVAIEAGTALDRVLAGADLLLCQVRPGGFAGRARDEELALRHGVPGDEGLGPSGLSCFLHGLRTMDRLHAAIAKHAPRVRMLHMTSPLSLNVARARNHFGLDCVGVCELPATTAARVRAHVEPLLGVGELQVTHAGTNHQGWLHQFLDGAGRDRTAEVIAAIRDPHLVRVDPAVIRRERAVPLPYLRLYYHTQREVSAQRRRPLRRGEELRRWAVELETAYLASRGGAIDRVRALLAQRRVDWYEAGTVPALLAFLRPNPTPVALNLPGHGALPGIAPAAIVELPCSASRAGVQARPVPPLPPGPARLNRRLVAFEAAALALADAPDEHQIAACLDRHPLVESPALAEAIAADLMRSLQEREPCEYSS